MSRKKIILIGSSVALLILISVLMVSYVAAYKTLHKERQAILKTPKDYGLEYENIEFKSRDGLNLKGWWINGDSDRVVIVAHGYGANRAGWSGTDKDGNEKYLNWLGVAPTLVKAGYSMLYFDFRASGESEGEVITLCKLESEDFLEALKWELKNKGKKNIGFLGFSMGGNVVLRAGVELNKMIKDGEVESGAIISIGPYIYTTMIDKSIKYWTSLPEFFTPFINQSAKLILQFDPSKEINPVNFINKIDPLPIYFIQSENDEIGDVNDVKSMYNKYSGPKVITIIPNAKRFIHYNYPKNNPDKILEFYDKYLNKTK